MSAITNNISALRVSGPAPVPPSSVVVLNSFSICLQKRSFPEHEVVPSNEVMRSFSCALQKRTENIDETVHSNVVMRSMSVQHYGWKYLNGAVQAQSINTARAKFNFHK